MNIQRTGRIIFRTPAAPVEQIYREVELDELVEDEIFLSAIYIASPVLYEEVCAYRKGGARNDTDKKKLEFSLLKYYLRSSSRSTPFGMFSACGSVLPDDHHEAGKIMVDPMTGIRRHSRLDMHYLCSLSQYLAEMPEVLTQLVFYPNQTMYRVGYVWRYIEYYYKNKNRVHQISAVDQSPILDLIITASKSGIDLRRFREMLLQYDHLLEQEEIDLFFQELVSSHILLSELEPAITGDDFLCQILETMKRLEPSPRIQTVIGIFDKVHELLQYADNQPMGNTLVVTYKNITEILRHIDLEFDEGKLFQVDSFWDLGDNDIISGEVCRQIDTAIDILALLSPGEPNEHLKNFCKRFSERYEEQEVPILQALDIESGIGYGQHPTNTDNRGRTIQWNWTQDFLYAKLLNAVKQNDQEITITGKDVDNIRKRQADENYMNRIAPSFSAMARIVKKPGIEEQRFLQIEHVGGSSAANLLGRFASHDKKIHAHISQICDKEQQINDHVTFAEVIHLPQSRVGNILLHPPFRHKEIPYMGVSSLPAEDQLLLDDIMVSVRQQKVVLRSRSLDKEIVPRLSNAHNYSYNAQPVYHFLCDLQYQEFKPGLFLNWGHLQQMHKFLPRVTCGQVILSPCQWNFQKQDFGMLLDIPGEEKYNIFDTFCEQHNIPELFVLSDGDNELPIYRHNKKLIALFLQTIRSRDFISLRELLIDNDSLVKDKLGRSYNCQLVVSYLKTIPTYGPSGIAESHPIKVNQDKRTFMPGSEWAFFKIYCGIKTTDEILSQCIIPAVTWLRQHHKIDKWFFLRFADPDHHIRVRFHLAQGEKGHLHEVIALFMQLLSDYENQGIIWKVSMDTYNREIERYRHMITQVEDIFWHDSESFIEFLQESKDIDNKEDFRWMFALKSIDQLMGDFELDIAEKMNLTHFMSETFNKEFNIAKKEKVGLDTLFRNKSKDIEGVLERTGATNVSSIYTILNRRTEKVRLAVESMSSRYNGNIADIARQDILFSCIHMVMNRICIENARHEEMVMYNNLYRYYRSKYARMKYN